MKDKNSDSNQHSTQMFTDKWILWCIIVVFIIWIVTPLILLNTISDSSFNKLADIFTPLDTLFSGLAFIGLVIAILMQHNALKLQRDDINMQREELVLQREELGLQREELKKSNEEYHQQNDTLAKQRFENTFFQMLDLYHKLVDRLKYEVIRSTDDPYWGFELYDVLISGLKSAPEAKIYEGRDVFIVSKTRLDAIIYKKYLVANKEGKMIIDRDIIQDSYRQFYYFDKFDASLSHYYMTLYRLFKLIDNSGLDDDQQRIYSGIIRAQLTPEELYLLFYNSICPNHGNPNFLFLIAKYKLMEHLQSNDVTEYADHWRIHSDMCKTVLKKYDRTNPQKVDIG